jgi:hypothetical protein
MLTPEHAGRAASFTEPPSLARRRSKTEVKVIIKKLAIENSRTIETVGRHHGRAEERELPTEEVYLEHFKANAVPGMEHYKGL